MVRPRRAEAALRLNFHRLPISQGTDWRDPRCAVQIR
jgi:hypothetical protein